MKIVVFGLTISSSGGDGHATLEPADADLGMHASYRPGSRAACDLVCSPVVRGALDDLDMPSHARDAPLIAASVRAPRQWTTYEEHS